MMFMAKNRQYAILADEDLMSLMEGGDEEAFAALPQAQGEAVNLTPEQEEAAKTVLGTGWAQAIS